MNKPIVICVDDERMVLTSLKAELKEALGEECVIETAEGGEDALEIITELLEDNDDIALVISDYIMPDIKGDELLKRVHTVSPGTLKIMLTGQADTQAVGNAVNYASLYRYIAKPWERQDLVLTVTEALRSFLQAKRIEEQNEELREINRTLEQKVEQRTHELVEKQAQLMQSEKMAALGNLVAGVAHEINNPLGALSSNNDILLRCIARIKEGITSPDVSAGQGDNQQSTLIETMLELGTMNRDAAARIMRIVVSLRNFARLDRSEEDRVDIHEGIDATLTLLEHETGSRIAVQRRYGQLPKVLCFPDQLNQVFMNVLVNAIQAIQGRGEITIATIARDTEVVVEIEDSGVGIPPENLSRIFEPGFTTKGVKVGTGLGLPIVQRIIEAHKGSVEVESQIGKGTRFRIRLPVKT